MISSKNKDIRIEKEKTTIERIKNVLHKTKCSSVPLTLALHKHPATVSTHIICHCHVNPMTYFRSYKISNFKIQSCKVSDGKNTVGTKTKPRLFVHQFSKFRTLSLDLTDVQRFKQVHLKKGPQVVISSDSNHSFKNKTTYGSN